MAKTPPVSKSSGSTSADKRMFYVSLAVFAVVCVFAIIRLIQPTTPQMPTVPASTDGTPQPANSITGATPAADTGLAETERLDLTRAVAACPDYGTERRSQMEQHLTWLANPAAIPNDLLPAFGANPTERLIFGMATYTSIEWRLAKRPATSCLLPIGQTLNRLLETFGTPPFEEFKA